MSLYREAGAGRVRSAVIGGLVVAVVALAAGFGLGRATAPDPSAADVVEGLADDLRPAAQGLLLIPNEYRQAFSGQGRESQAVTGALERIRATVGDARADLRVLDPDGLRAFDAGLAQLTAAVGRKDSPVEVRRLTRTAAERLAALPGGQ